MSDVLMYKDVQAAERPDPKRLATADAAPPWRQYVKKPEIGLEPREPRAMDEDQAAKGRTYVGKPPEADLVNAALFLRRPILITGDAGVGKSTLAYAVAYQLGLGNVLRWGVTSRSTLKDALYQYDAIARLHELSAAREGGLGSTQQTGIRPVNNVISSAGWPAKLWSSIHPGRVGDSGARQSRQTEPQPAEDVGRFITLGALGTALLPTRADGYFPRVLLVDEIDKSDADLPSDLLHILEEGSFYIPEIGRQPILSGAEVVTVRTSDRAIPEVKIPRDGWVRCDDFPFIVMTSNGERDFPPAFLRRCLRLDIKRQPDDLRRIVAKHLADAADTKEVLSLIEDFSDRVDGKKATLATDQLLNAIFLLQSGFKPLEKSLRDAILRSLSESPTGGTRT
jgi:MoxR-like ATPase